MAEGIKKFSTHVCLVSKQAAANFLPIVTDGFEPNKVICIVTDQMQEAFENLKNGIQVEKPSLQGHIEKLHISTTNDIKTIKRELRDYFDSIDCEGFALNATGGTKLMMLAAYDYFQNRGIPSFYLSQQENKILLLSSAAESAPTEKISAEFNFGLRSYLKSYGYNICPSDADFELIQEEREFIDEIIANSNYKKAIASLNWFASEAKNNSLTYESKRKFGEGVNALLDKLCDQGLCKATDKTIKFTDEKARFFANGGWLEEYTFEQVKKIQGIRELKINLKIKANSSQAGNEIDVAFIYEGRLYLIECKTGIITSDNWQEYVDKLHALGEIGGSATRKILISYQPVDKQLAKRAKDLGINLINENLRDLKNTIERLISPK